MAPLRCTCTLLLAALCLLVAAGVRAESLRLPLTVDLPLLRTLIVQQAYPIPGEKASILNMGQGCNQIALLSPRVSVDQGYLRYQTGVAIKWGTPVMGACVTPFTWEGSVVLWQRPRINGQWQLSFETVNSVVLDTTGRQIKAVDLLWNLIKDHVHGYLGRIAINLAPPVQDMQASLLPMFGPGQQAMGQRFLASMRPEQPVVQADGVQLHILAEIDLPPRTEAPPPAPVNQQDYARVIELWHSWDAFLIFQLKQFTEYPLSEDDRQILLDTMLTARYEFSSAIAEQQVSTEFIRGQFLRGWTQLAPVFRNHLPKRRKNNLLGYLAFFTASDALRVLDQLGPAVGLEINADGFRRLAAMISPTPYQEADPDSEEVDPELRKALGLDPLPEEELPSDQPVPVTEPTDREPTSCAPPAGWRHLAGLFAPAQAWAAGTGQASREDIRRWTAELTPADTLLPRVQEVLQEAAARQHQRLAKGAGRTDWFDRMVLASAWQESCFRQFHIDRNTITFLLSYNNTSVGIMQVNEKVWRGVYNTRQLRWNIAYNSRAGCEILSLYLRDYLLKKKAPMDLTSAKGQRFLAGWLYALYNGGPGQRNPFVSRYNSGKMYRSEQLFLAKYDTVVKGNWMDRVHCLP